MTEREKVIKGLECCGYTRFMDKCQECPYDGKDCFKRLKTDALALLKAQEPATTEPKRIELADETKAWLDEMDAVNALGNIANICIDWDGYRTADGLGGLVNEIWAYARYCADRLAKAQEPVRVTVVNNSITGLPVTHCPKCHEPIDMFYGVKGIETKYCPWCGQAVKWE